jgi:branched-chain amino acid aminotransferase
MNDSSSSKLYGRGVFSTISIINGEPFLWAKHWLRLVSNAAKLGVDISEYGEGSVLNSLSAAIEERKIGNGRVRITFADESASKIWGGDTEKKTGLSIIVGQPRQIPEQFKLTLSPHDINTTSPHVGIKSCNYLEPLMSLEEANNRGFHEAIRLNERDEVASACMANVFWLKGGKLFTPSLETGCLAGTTREFVLENLECEEVVSGIDAVGDADAIFLTSAGLGVVEVAEFEGRMFSASCHPITSLIPTAVKKNTNTAE